MKKITQDDIQSHYKEAIREKYRVEKNEGKYSNYLSNPSQAVLRDLCWEIFNSEPKVDDIAIYRNFFRADFIPKEVDTSQQYTDKFKKVGAFFKAERETAKISTVELAAILVDFQPRPFNKFRREIDPENQKLIDELRDTEHHKSDFFSDALIDEAVNENFPDLKNEESEKDKNEEVDQDEAEEIEQDENQSWETIPTGIVDVSPPAKGGGNDVGKSGINRYLVIAAFLAALSFIIYSNISKKDCMQWTNDHYEKINKSDEGYCDTYYDARYFNLKKITVCDTTKFFDDKGAAKVFYIKIGNSIECYNQFAPYPENTQRFLKPITQRMIDKYLSNRPKCK